MSLALRLGVGALALAAALAAVFVLPVVLAARGHFDPPRNPAAYEGRVALARGYLAPAQERLFTSNSEIRRAMAESLGTLERQHPEVLRAHRYEIDAMYAAWLEAIAEFSTSAHAHWFAAHFSADDIRARFEREGGWSPAGMRRFVVFQLHKGELDRIGERSELFMMCHLAESLLPALARLGAGSDSTGDALRASCRDAAAGGWLDPAKPFH